MESEAENFSAGGRIHTAFLAMGPLMIPAFQFKPANLKTGLLLKQGLTILAELEMVNFSAGVKIGQVNLEATIMLHLTFQKESAFPATGLLSAPRFIFAEFEMANFTVGETINTVSSEQDLWELTTTFILLKRWALITTGQKFRLISRVLAE